jgi:hypothetical protein
MATVKVNSRSPYYVTATGGEGSAVQNASLNITGPATGVTNTDITLTAVANNFTPVSYAWTGGAIAGTGTEEVTFTETSDDTVEYGVTATDSAGNEYTASKVVSWSSNTQYTATLTVTNSISGPSQGYTGTVTKNATNISQTVQSINTSQGTTTYSVTGEENDTYNFDIALSLASGFNDDAANLAISTASFSGSFATSNISLASTLTGTVARNSDYRLSVDKSQVKEGQTFTVTLIDANSATPNGTSIPFAITGTVSEDDLQRGSLTGAFVIGNSGETNKATQTFEVLSDNVTESTSGETFILTLNNFPSVTTTVTLFDETEAETRDPQPLLISSVGYDSSNGACAVTATETVYYGLLPNQTFGNGVTLYQSDALQTPYSGGGKYFKIGSNHNGRIGVNNNGELTGYVQCPTTPVVTSCTIPESSTSPNNAVVSSSFATIAGANGINACNLTADIDVYYNGSITQGASLYTVKDANNNLSSPYGGTDNWYKIILNCDDDTPQEHYAKVLSYPPGYVSQIFVCGSDIVPTTSITAAPSVTINMASDDGNNIAFAYVSQRVELTAITQNITNPSYQWEKGSSQGNLSDISGETQQNLVINEIGGGGETQTSTGVVYYNCKVSGTGVTDEKADTDEVLTWQDRPSFATTFVSSGSIDPVNYGACTGTPVTIYGDRDSLTNFCVPSATFFSNPQGSSSPSLSTGWYAFDDGTNHNLRYIEANGIPATGCVTGGCTETPDPTPSQPTAGYATIQKCPNQTNAGIVFDVAFDGFTRDAGQIVQLTDFAGNGTSSGCYEITQVYVTLSNWDYTLSSDEFVRLQPYGSCEECVGDIQVEEEVIVDPNKYYGAYRQCGNESAPLFYVVSNSEIPNVTRFGTNTQSCRSLVYELHNNQGNIAAFSDTAEIYEDLFFTEFNDCTTCLQGDTVTPDPLAYFRQYNNCDGNGGFIIAGSTTDLDATGHWPAVVEFGDICYNDGGNTSTTSNRNINDLVTYPDCATCGYVPPAPEDPVTIDTNVVRITSSTFSTITNACAGLTSNFPTTLYYTGFFGDGTQLYSDSALTRVYAPASTDFYLSEDGYYFKIGTGTGDPRGEIYSFGQCGDII